MIISNQLFDEQLALKIVNIVSAIVTCISAVITVKAARETSVARNEAQEFAKNSRNDAVEQARSLLATTQQLQAVSENLSTRFLGKFPAYLPDIQKLVQSSSKTLNIMGVVAGHGSFTDFTQWLTTSQMIQSKVRALKNSEKETGDPFDARLLCCNPETQRSVYGDQYYERRNEPEWKQWKATHSGRLEDFMKRRGISDSVDSLQLEKFIEYRIEEDVDIQHETYRDLNALYGSEAYPVFCWIADGAAIFSLKSEDKDGNYAGLGFFTRDQAIVNMLKSTFEYYWRRTKKKDTSCSREMLS